MSKHNYAALNEVTRGCVFRLVNPETERCAVYFGGGSIIIYDLAGGHVDTVSAPYFGGNVVVRRKALELLGKGVCNE